MSDENERTTETMFGIDLFTWAELDEAGDQDLIFDNVDWCFESMKQFNGKSVQVYHSSERHGCISVEDADGDWNEQSLLDIPEFREALMAKIAEKNK